MKYFWNVDNESDILMDSELNNYIYIKKSVAYSLNGTSYYILDNLSVFDGKSVEDCAELIKRHYVNINNDVLKDVELCLDQLVKADMVVAIDSDDVDKNLFNFEKIKTKIKKEGYAVVQCYPWYGKFKAEQTVKIIVDTSFEYFFDNIGCLYDELEDQIKEETGECTWNALFLPSKNEINTFRMMQLNYLKCETNKFDSYEQFAVGKVLLPQCIASIIPKLCSCYSLRNEGNEGGFLYNFDMDTLKIINSTAALVMEAMNGNTIEEIVVYCLQRMKEFDGYIFEKSVFDIIDFIWNLKAEGVIYFE